MSGNRVSSMSALTSGGAGGIYNRDVEHYGRMGSRRCSRGAFARWRTCSPNAIVDLEILAGQHAGVGRRVGRSDSPASRTSEAALERRDDGDSRRCRASAHWTDGWKSVSIRRTLTLYLRGTRGSPEVERNCENSAVLTYDAHGATQQQSAAISPLSEHSLIGSRDVPPHTKCPPPLGSDL